MTERWIPELFPPLLVPRVQALAAQDRVIFFQGQLRFLASEALRIEKIDSEASTDLPNVELGHLLLGAAELLNRPHIPPTDNLDIMAKLIADFLPVYEIDSPNEPIMLFLRFYCFLTVIIPRLPDNLRTFDVAAEFEAIFCFPLKLYYLFVFALIEHTLLDRNKESGGTNLGGSIGKQWFKQTKLTNEQIDKVFASVCCTQDDLPNRKTPHGYADFEFLKDHPYFKHKDQLYCLDYEYAAAKLESGILWRVASSFPEQKRLTYFGFWGEVFEEYVAWLFEQYPNERKNEFYRAPKYQDLEQPPICDAIVICDRIAVLIEAKLGTCAANVRYSGDYEKFRKFLEERLVSGTDRKVGVAQLLTAVQNITKKPQDSLPTCLRGIKKFIPLIITKDDIGSSWMTNAYLNARFANELNRKLCKGYTVAPLVSMSISTLERMMPALSRMALSDVLENRMRGDKTLRQPFEAASSHVRKTWGMSKHIELLSLLRDEMIREFGMGADAHADLSKNGELST